MREEVIREVIGRLLTDSDFLDAVKYTPGKALRPYQLTDEELAAILATDNGTLGIARLETRISAASSRPLMADDDPGCCGCVNVAPKTCPRKC